MAHLPVLIVGAGPTGLMMACELNRHDIPFRIIDKKSEPIQGSNATWIQTRTLEIFNLVGLVDKFLKIGHRCEAINLYANGKSATTIPLTQIASEYPFILMLPQSETERLLSEKLAESKCQVERSLELIDIKQTNEGVVSSLRHANGNIENVTSVWVIACDGANSKIRELCQTPFSGDDLPEQFMVADAQMSSFLPNNEIHVFFGKGTIFPDKGTIFSAFPWGSNKYRLTANLYMEGPRKTFTEHQVRDVVAERTFGNYVVDSVSWISPFWIHGKIVKDMRCGSIFLTGDAAHIHSPIGGQGMNTGLQDAFNLAWKLALVIKGAANQSLLDSFQTERYPLLKDVVTQGNFFTKMALFDKSFFSKLRKFSHKVSERPSTAKKISTELTQLKINYKKSPIIDYQPVPEPKSPRQGKRAPNVKISDSKKLYEYLHNTQHNILLFPGEIPEKNISTFNNLQNNLDKKFPMQAKLFIVSKKNLVNVNNVILDPEGMIHRRYHVNKQAVYIIRPDNYIAYYSDKIDTILIEKFFQKYLLSN